MPTLIHSPRPYLFHTLRLLIILTMLLSGSAISVKARAPDAPGGRPPEAAAQVPLLAAGDDAQFVMVDAFETHNWHAPDWGDTHTLSYTTAWKTQGNTSLELTATAYRSCPPYSECHWSLYSTGAFDAETPDAIVVDVKNGSNFQQALKIEFLDAGGVQCSLARR